MRVLRERPPNFDAVAAVFDIAKQRGILFAYGDTIYNPDNVYIPGPLIAHEAVHGSRQAGDVEGWWKRYLDDPKFRLDEEVPAHQAEYRCFRLTQPKPLWKARNEYLRACAQRLSGPLYGRVISFDKALELIEAG